MTHAQFVALIVILAVWLIANEILNWRQRRALKRIFDKWSKP